MPAASEQPLSPALWKKLRHHLGRGESESALHLLATLSDDDLHDAETLPGSTLVEYEGEVWVDLIQDLPPCPEVGRVVWERVSPRLLTRLREISPHGNNFLALHSTILHGLLRWGLPSLACAFITDYPSTTDALKSNVLSAFLDEGYGHLLSPVRPDILSQGKKGALKEKEAIVPSQALPHAFWTCVNLDKFLTLPEDRWTHIASSISTQCTPRELVHAVAATLAHKGERTRPHRRQSRTTLLKRLSSCAPHWEEAFLDHCIQMWGSQESSHDWAGKPEVWCKEDNNVLAFLPSSGLKRAALKKGPEALRALLWTHLLKGEASTQDAWWRWALKHRTFEELWYRPLSSSEEPQSNVQQSLSASTQQKQRGAPAPSATCEYALSERNLPSPSRGSFFPSTLAQALTSLFVFTDVRSSFRALVNVTSVLKHVFSTTRTALRWCPDIMQPLCHQECSTLLDAFLVRHAPLFFHKEAIHASKLEHPDFAGNVVMFLEIPKWSHLYTATDKHAFTPAGEWFKFWLSREDFQAFHATLYQWGQTVEETWWDSPVITTPQDLNASYTWLHTRTYEGSTLPDGSFVEKEAEYYLHFQEASLQPPHDPSLPLSRLDRWRPFFPWLEQFHVNRCLQETLEQEERGSSEKTSSRRPRL